MSFWYEAAGEAFMSGQIDLTSDDIRLVLIDVNDYAADAISDVSLADIPGGARVATTASAMTGCTVTGKLFDADTVTLPAVVGDPCEAMVIYRHTGTESTSTLLLYIDGAAVGLPVTPDADDILIQFTYGVATAF